MRGKIAIIAGLLICAAMAAAAGPFGMAGGMSHAWSTGQTMANSFLHSVDGNDDMLQRLLEHMAAQVRRNLPIKGADGTTLVSVVAAAKSIRATYEVPADVAEAFREPGRSNDYLAKMYRTQCGRNTFDTELRMGGTVYMDYMSGPTKVTAMVFHKDTCAAGVFPPKDQDDLSTVGPR